ncbi:MAG: hypothetical protein RLZZ292_1842 [Bacteroidota bacterium]|jgi:hypothetical protein
MTTIEFQSYWAENFAETPPINHLFKHLLNEKWLRTHSLPEAKRYAETDEEWLELLERQHTLFQDLMPTNEPFYLLLGLYSQGEKVYDESIFEAYNFFKTLTFNELEKIDLFKTSGDWYDEGMFYTPYFAEVKNNPNDFNVILKAIANDEIRVFFLNPTNNCIIAPYDGGVDLILKDNETMLFYKEKYKNWLSEREDGL